MPRRFFVVTAIILFAFAAPADARAPNQEQCADLRSGIEAGPKLRDGAIAAATRRSELLEDYLRRHRAALGELWYDELVALTGQVTALDRQPLDRHSTEPVAAALSALRAICPDKPAEPAGR